MNKNTHTSPPQELLESLKNMTFHHPVQGEFPFKNLFNAHSGFICLIPSLETSLLDTFKGEKKELDPLGLQLIVVTGKAYEDNDILIITEPDLLKKHSISENKYFFIEEKWNKGFFVASPEEFLPIAADYIVLDSGDTRHLTEKIKAILKEKGIETEGSPKWCCCNSCPKDHKGL